MSSRQTDRILTDLRRESVDEDLRMALQRAHEQIAKLKRGHDALVEAVYAAAKDAALTVKVPPAPKMKGSRKEQVALLHLTDWQRGKETLDYNSQVCDDRVMLAVAKTVEITDLHRSSVPVRECHLMLGGDMVEGTMIFPGQAWQVDSTLYTQLFGVVALIERVVVELLRTFTKVTVWEEYGNHGRIGKKDEGPPQDNVDLFAYRVAEDALRRSGIREDRLVWKRATSWHQIVEVGDYRALLIHGDEIRSFGGNHPSYGIVKKVSAWAAGVVAPFRDCYIGHFHRPDTYTLPAGGSIHITGSTESGSEYAREFIAAMGRPSQRLHYVDPVRGRTTAEYRLWLD